MSPMLSFPPGRDLDQDGKLLGLAHPRLQPHPGPFRLGTIGVGRCQDVHLLVHPVGAATPAEVGDERAIDVAQVGDVGHRIGDLRRRKRAAGPVGEAVRLVETVAGDALHELVVGDRIAMAEHHGGDLGVEQRTGDDTGAVPDDLDVLARRMEHLQHPLVGHQREERLEIDSGGQRVDHDGLLRACELGYAEQGIIGGLPQELGIDGHERMTREAFAGGRQIVCCCYEVHGAT
jgi:hypothetical protein